MEHSNSSFILEDKPSRKANNVKLNQSLQTQYLDLDDEDVSLWARTIRQTTKVVGQIFTPQQILGLLRVLKAATLAFLALGILATIMYMIVVQILASEKVRRVAGGTRDIVLRVYALGLSVLGFAIELDYTRLIKRLNVLKGFLPRAGLYFLISQLIAPPPVKKLLVEQGVADNASNYYDDDQSFSNYDAGTTIPSSSIGFQRVTSFVLACCALGYLVCGVLCFDRFRAKAFLTTTDPRITTAIPPVETNSKAQPFGVARSLQEAENPNLCQAESL